MVCIAGDVLHISPIRINTIATQVRPQRSVEFLRAVLHHRPQSNQLAFAPFRWTRGSRPNIFTVTGYEVAEIECAHGVGFLSGQMLIKTLIPVDPSFPTSAWEPATGRSNTLRTPPTCQCRPVRRAVWVNLTINAGRPLLREHEYKIDRLLLAHKHHA